MWTPHWKLGDEFIYPSENQAEVIYPSHGQTSDAFCGHNSPRSFPYPNRYEIWSFMPITWIPFHYNHTLPQNTIWNRYTLNRLMGFQHCCMFSQLTYRNKKNKRVKTLLTHFMLQFPLFQCLPVFCRNSLFNNLQRSSHSEVFF